VALGLERYRGAGRLPTLAERPEDLEELVWSMLPAYNERAHGTIKTVPDEVWSALRRHNWPGNVRELRNVIERCVLLSAGEVLELRWLNLDPTAAPEGPPAPAGGRLCFQVDGSTSLDEIERRVLVEALERSRGNVMQAARLLRVSRQTMRYRVEKHGLKLDPDSEAPPA
jgi:transcriptional regulator with PAS, ATPase and Fis domain